MLHALLCGCTFVIVRVSATTTPLETRLIPFLILYHQQHLPYNVLHSLTEMQNCQMSIFNGKKKKKLSTTTFIHPSIIYFCPWGEGRHLVPIHSKSETEFTEAT